MVFDAQGGVTFDEFPEQSNTTIRRRPGGVTGPATLVQAGAGNVYFSIGDPDPLVVFNVNLDFPEAAGLYVLR